MEGVIRIGGKEKTRYAEERNCELDVEQYGTLFNRNVIGEIRLVRSLKNPRSDVRYVKQSFSERNKVVARVWFEQSPGMSRVTFRLENPTQEPRQLANSRRVASAQNVLPVPPHGRGQIKSASIKSRLGPTAREDSWHPQPEDSWERVCSMASAVRTPISSLLLSSPIYPSTQRINPIQCPRTPWPI